MQCRCSTCAVQALTTGAVYRVLTGGAEDVTGVGSVLEYSAYGFFCLCRKHTAS